MMGDCSERIDYSLARVVVVMALSLAAIVMVAGAAGALSAETPTETEGQIGDNQLFSNGVENGNDTGLAVEGDEIELGEGVTVDVLSSQVHDITTDELEETDVVFVPEATFALHSEWGDHYPGSGTVDELVDAGVLETDSTSDIADEGLGIAMNGVWEYGCDTYSSMLGIAADDDPWCGWHEDIGSPADDTTAAHIDYRTAGIQDLEFTTGQLTYDYEVYSETHNEWVELPRGSGETYFGVGQGYWEWTDSTDEEIITELSEEQHEGLYHIDLAVSDLPDWIAPDMNDWAFDVDEMANERVRITYDAPQVIGEGGGLDVTNQEPVDPWGDRFDAMFEITESLDPLAGSQAGVVMNDESIFNPFDGGDEIASDDLGDLAADMDENEEYELTSDDDLDDAIEALSNELFNIPEDEEELMDVYGEFNVWDGVETAEELLEESSADEQAIVVLSDGKEPAYAEDETGFFGGIWDAISDLWEEDTQLSESEQVDDNDEVVEELAEDIDVPVYTVGLGDTADTYRLEQVLAEETDGEYYHVDEAGALAAELGADGEGEVALDINHPEVAVNMIEDGETASVGSGTSADLHQVEQTLPQDGSVSFEMEIRDSSSYTDEGVDESAIQGENPTQIADVPVSVTHNVVEQTGGVTETVEMDVQPDGDDGVFKHGDDVDELDDYVEDYKTEAMSSPSGELPAELTDGGELVLENAALVAMTVDTGEYKGYTLVYVESDDEETFSTQYDVSVDEDAIEEATDDWYEGHEDDGVVAGDEVTIPVEIENLGDDEDDDGNELSEMVSVRHGDSGTLDSEEIGTGELDNGTTMWNATWETSESDGGSSEVITASSESMQDETDEDVAILSPSLDIEIDGEIEGTNVGFDVVGDDVAGEIDEIEEGSEDIKDSMEMNISAGDEAYVTIPVRNYGPVGDTVEVAFDTGESVETDTVEVDRYEDGDSGQNISVFQYQPGFEDLGLDVDELDSSGAEDVTLTAEAYDQEETMEMTLTYDIDVDPSELEDDEIETDLDPISIDVDEIEFDE